MLCGVRKEKDADSLKLEWKERKAEHQDDAEEGGEPWTGGRMSPVILDVTDASHVTNVVERINQLEKDEGSPFVGLVNNAGVGKEGMVELFPLEDVRWIFEVGERNRSRLLSPLFPSTFFSSLSLSLSPPFSVKLSHIHTRNTDSLCILTSLPGHSPPLYSLLCRTR